MAIGDVHSAKTQGACGADLTVNVGSAAEEGILGREGG